MNENKIEFDIKEITELQEKYKRAYIQLIGDYSHFRENKITEQDVELFKTISEAFASAIEYVELKSLSEQFFKQMGIEMPGETFDDEDNDDDEDDYIKGLA